jgi:phosphoribosylanthranilate isomerase
MRTRIKICGITRPEDAEACAALGADAVGFVFYPPSPRAVSAATAALLAQRLPPFMAVVALFVNPRPDEVDAVLAQVPVSLLQFHGDEDDAFCRRFGRPFIKVARVKPEFDLLEYAARFPSAQAILLDAHVEGFGGAGQSFDWSLIPAKWSLPWILSGGLSPANVGEAVRHLRPSAVDVSSGVEQSKGVKDYAKIADFIAEVRAADDYRECLPSS